MSGNNITSITLTARVDPSTAMKAAKFIAGRLGSTPECKEVLLALGLYHDLRELRHGSGSETP